MISAMIHSLRQKNNQDITREDPRISTIFDALLHLPDQLMWEVLRNACHDREILPVDLGVLEHYEFWPQWGSNGTENGRYVEPDVFLRFSKADLIIEAKRSDYEGQSQRQWKNELIAYQNVYGRTDKTVFLVALGGNGSNLQNQMICLPKHKRIVVKCSWDNLHAVLVDKREKLTEDNQRVVDSLLLACSLFGFRSYVWLDARSWVSKYATEIPKDYRNLVFRR
jgi:hypothetical protein